jgi:membrane fusion protein, adhesin transport system
MTRPSQTRGSAILWVVLFGMAALAWWATWAELDIVTRAPGQVIASSRNQVVQAPDGGVLSAMLVREGDAVRKGQVLFRFEATKAGAALEESHAKAAALKAAVSRLQAEVLGQEEPVFKGLERFPAVVREQRALFLRRKQAIQAEVDVLKKSLLLAEQELQMNQPLLATGDVSRAEILKLQRQVADIQGQITNRNNKYFQDAQADLTKSREDLDGVLQILAQRREQLLYTEVASPMDGVVRNVRLTTLGGVARPGDEILQIVPSDGRLIIEAKVKPADIGFLKTGLPTTIKLDAYDYAIYGSLNGQVSYISPDTLQEDSRTAESVYYRVQVTLDDPDHSHGSKLKLDIQPGMTGQVEIKSGQQTVWRYLTKPVVKTLQESMGER